MYAGFGIDFWTPSLHLLQTVQLESSFSKNQLSGNFFVFASMLDSFFLWFWVHFCDNRPRFSGIHLCIDFGMDFDRCCSKKPSQNPPFGFQFQPKGLQKLNPPSAGRLITPPPSRWGAVLASSKLSRLPHTSGSSISMPRGVGIWYRFGINCDMACLGTPS